MKTKATSQQTQTNVRRVAKAVLAAVIVFSICKVVASYRGKIDLANIDLRLLFVALGMTLAYRLANACGWSFVLRALDIRLSSWKALRIWITSEACRWLPGSVWSYGSRALQAKNHGVPAVTAGASLVLEMLLTIGAWCLTAVIGLAFYRDSFLALLEKIPFHTLEQVPTSAIVVAFAGCLAVVFALYATLKQKFAAKLSPILDRLRSLRSASPSVSGVVGSLSYYVLMCTINGVAAWIVFRAVAPNANVPLLAVIGANAAAWLVGFFAIMAPGGLVVREGAMATLLVAWLPAEQAIAAAVVWRFVQILVEITCIAGAYAIPFCGKMLRRQEAQPIATNC